MSTQMDSTDARAVLARCGIALGADFHALCVETVYLLLVEADRIRYHAPPGANGSRARYFYAYMQRRAARGE